MHTFPDRGCARRGHGDSPRRACRALAWWRELLSSWWWQRRRRGDHRRDHRPGRRCRDRLARVLRGTPAAGLLWVAARLLPRTPPPRSCFWGAPPPFSPPPPPAVLLRLLTRFPPGASRSAHASTTSFKIAD